VLSAEGYRLIWFHSTRKAELDSDARYKQVARTTARRVIDLFEEVQRHELIVPGQPPVSFKTDLTVCSIKLMQQCFSVGEDSGRGPHASPRRVGGASTGSC
jgi:hypothetical protein